MSTESDSQTGALTAPRIMASVTLQQWGGRKNNNAIEIETVEFDAAPVLATLSQEDRSLLEDNEADDIFYSAVHLGLVAEHVGPFDVHVREALDLALEENPDFFEKFAAFLVLRAPGAILESPLSAYEIGVRADDNGRLSGLAVMDMSELIENDIEQHNDAIGDYLIGSCQLMESTATPVAVRDGQIVMEIRGDASALIDGFSEEECDQYEAGRAVRASAKETVR